MRFNLEEIKERRKVAMHWTPIMGRRNLLRDIDALITEVERQEAENNLMGEMLIARGCDKPVAEVVRLGDQVETLEAARDALRELVNAMQVCSCIPAYTDRGLIAPDCMPCQLQPELGIAQKLLGLEDKEK